MQRVLIFKIDNEEICLGTSPYFFDEIEGLSNVDTDIASSSTALHDGAKVNNIILQPRVVNISGRIRGINREEAFKLRRNMIHILSSKRGLGKLIVRYSNNDEYYIEAMVQNGVQIKEKNQGSIQGNVFEYDVEFYCPNPYWKTEEVFETYFTQVMPLWEFETEIELDNEESFKFGEVYHNETTILYNKGDVPTGFYCEVTGKITDYFILKHLEKNQYIKIEMDFTNVKGIEIYSEQGRKKIYILYKDGTKEIGYKYMDLNSEFFELHAGANQLRFETNSKDVDLNVKLIHKNLYTGI